MTTALGIDTGGTYTDAVLVDHDSGRVLSSTKALTTHHDLCIGVRRAVASVLDVDDVAPAEVDLVALSTTLATNAIVERQGSPICLLLIGYDRELIRQYNFGHDLVTKDVVYVRGGHDVVGNEAQPLDERAAREAILARRDQVEAFAVSGYFGVRNPAHELRVRALVEALTGLPVTCGHELTTRLNSVRRATTAALNAQLIPLLQDLIATVRRTLDDLGIAARLMVVKGDGSLVRAEWAMRRPIETILSGPAASAVGAWHLAGRRDVWVVDVGGTTTDIAALHAGRPRLNPEGAQVGGWRTMVEAVDVHTVGLGGDSHVRLNQEGRLVIGPRRVVPLCLLASKHPQVVDVLRGQLRTGRQDRLAGQFALARRQTHQSLSDEEQRLVRHLTAGPQTLISLAEGMRYGSLVARRVGSLEARRVVLRSGFTPTDALHALGRFDRWDVDASRLGAQLLAAQANVAPESLCSQVVSGVSKRVATELVSKVLSDEATPPAWEREPTAAALLARALGDVPDSDLGCRLRLDRPVVAVGAPVEAYMPQVARQLHTKLVLPRHAEVANALGAVAASVVQLLRVVIRPLRAERAFRAYLPNGVHDFPTIEEAVAYARQVVPAQLEALAREAGADQIEIHEVREDRTAPVAGGSERIHLATELTFTAVGRPRLAQRSPA